jgi:anti-sigma regulatory factor (Ser/Thr protein kinase)
VTNAARSFACDHTVPGAARAWARKTVLSMLPASPATIEIVNDVEVVVSELVTNAVLAGSLMLQLYLDSGPGRLRIEVSDDAAGWPARRDTSPADDHGRGLTIVAALSSRWGVRQDGGAKAVWAELALPPSMAHPRPPA